MISLNLLVCSFVWHSEPWRDGEKGTKLSRGLSDQDDARDASGA